MNSIERRKICQCSSWLISTITHFSVAIVVALVMRPAGHGNSAASTLIVSMATADPVELEVATFTASPLTETAASDLDAKSNWTDPSDLADETALDVASPWGTGRPRTARRAGAIANTSVSANRRGESEGGAPGAAAEFFGTVAKGDRFVYLLDYSRSMDGKRDEQNRTRFGRAREELLRSIEQLSDKQRFCVILFSGQTRPMLDEPDNLRQYLPASDENKYRLKMWLSTITPDSGTNPNDSLAYGTDLAPSAIFMLSDGEFNIDRPAEIGILSRTVADGRDEIIERTSQTRVPIHTIAYEDEAGAKNMQLLSSVTQGYYRFVEPSPETARNMLREAGGSMPRFTPRPPVPRSSDQLAARPLMLGKGHESLGRLDEAAECYRKVVAQFPGTTAAKEAAKRLEQLELRWADEEKGPRPTLQN